MAAVNGKDEADANGIKYDKNKRINEKWKRETAHTHTHTHQDRKQNGKKQNNGGKVASDTTHKCTTKKCCVFFAR